MKTPSLVRLKPFMLDTRVIARRIGALAARDRAAVAEEFQTFMPMRAE